MTYNQVEPVTSEPPRIFYSFADLRVVNNGASTKFVYSALFSSHRSDCVHLNIAPLYNISIPKIEISLSGCADDILVDSGSLTCEVTSHLTVQALHEDIQSSTYNLTLGPFNPPSIANTTIRENSDDMWEDIAIDICSPSIEVVERTGSMRWGGIESMILLDNEALRCFGNLGGIATELF